LSHFSSIYSRVFPTVFPGFRIDYEMGMKAVIIVALGMLTPMLFLSLDGLKRRLHPGKYLVFDIR